MFIFHHNPSIAVTSNHAHKSDFLRNHQLFKNDVNDRGVNFQELFPKWQLKIKITICKHIDRNAS